MPYSITVAGYTFENPPEEYRKLARLSNSPQKAYDRRASDFYQSDSQNLQFQVEGTLALDPPLGETEDDLAELERLQTIAIEGGEVEVQFDPFFSGTCIIEDDPFRQSAGESTYSFTFSVNSESTDASSYPARSPPTTGNTFELGSLDIGYDPDSVSQNYERETAKVKRLQGVARTVDNAGLVPTVNVSGKIDGEGQATLWQKARDNVMAYLGAEFQNGWCLIDSLSIRNDPEAPDYLDGLFQYDLDVMVVKNPASGIGDVTTYIDQEVKESGTYSSDSGAGDSDFTDLEFTVSGGSGSLDGDYIEWNSTTLTLSDNDTNYVYVDDADADGYGTVKANQSAFPADGLELYRVETSGGVITKVVDVRAILIEDQESEEGDSTEETIGGDIYLTIAAGDYEMNTGVVSSWNDTRLLLQPNTTNYIWAEDPEADGTATVETNTSGYPTTSDFVKLYRAETDADSVTNLTDDRPAGISDGGTDTSSADLNFQDTLSVSDGAFAFERLLSLSDSLALASDPSIPWLGLADFADSLAVSEGPLDARGIAPLTETLAVRDGGTAITGGSAESNTFTDPSDFDNAVAESGVVHENTANTDHTDAGTLKKGYSAQNPLFSTNLKVAYHFNEDSGTTINELSGNSIDASLDDGSLGATGLLNTSALDLDTSSATATLPYDSSWDTIQGIDHTVLIWVKIKSVPGDTEHFYSTLDSTCTIWIDGSVLRAHAQDAEGTLHYGDTSFNPSTGQWYLLGHRYRESDEQINSIIDASISGDLTQSTSRNVNSSDMIIGGTNQAERGVNCYIGGFWIWHEYLSASQIQTFYDVVDTPGTLTTSTQTFASSVKPNLRNLNYALNGGTASLDVVGSPGTASEEVITVTLDGSAEFDLSWGSSHSDFRVKATIDGTGVEDTPTITDGDLQTSAVVGDDDQNTSTHWEIRGARYDTSGNEYEGGGITSKYGA